jgi:ketosteroid isomerase-like protein
MCVSELKPACQQTPTNSPMPFAEIAIFTVRDGRIIEERFFYD